jgi:hypothetical protein
MEGMICLLFIFMFADLRAYSSQKPHISFSFVTSPMQISVNSINYK